MDGLDIGAVSTELNGQPLAAGPLLRLVGPAYAVRTRPSP